MEKYDFHYNDVIMCAIASQITSLTIVFSTIYSDADQGNLKLRVTGLCVGNSPGPVNSPHKWPVTREMFLFDDVIILLVTMKCWHLFRDRVDGIGFWKVRENCKDLPFFNALSNFLSWWPGFLHLCHNEAIFTCTQLSISWLFLLTWFNINTNMA